MKVCSGDQKAFEQFFRHWFPVLKAFCNAYVKDDCLAKDIVQESFIELWKRKNTISKPASLASYLFTIVKNRCFKEIESRRAQLNIGQRKDEEFLKNEVDYFIDSMTSLDMICIAEQRKAVAEIIRNLPDQSRKVVVMKVSEKLTCKQIASLLNLSTRTVENEYFRAVKAIRDKVRKLCLI
ncbi:MAG: RNA polymerase sigma-70 factor [Bacteroidales bacterium]|nr:RNA polymerase sigma-70 factor [Bacteroidales bacterium]